MNRSHQKRHYRRIQKTLSAAATLGALVIALSAQAQNAPLWGASQASITDNIGVSDRAFLRLMDSGLFRVTGANLRGISPINGQLVSAVHARGMSTQSLLNSFESFVRANPSAPIVHAAIYGHGYGGGAPGYGGYGGIDATRAELLTGFNNIGIKYGKEVVVFDSSCHSGRCLQAFQQLGMQNQPGGVTGVMTGSPFDPRTGRSFTEWVATMKNFYKSVEKNFDLADLNKDGAISAGELTAYKNYAAQNIDRSFRDIAIAAENPNTIMLYKDGATGLQQLAQVSPETLKALQELEGTPPGQQQSTGDSPATKTKARCAYLGEERIENHKKVGTDSKYHDPHGLGHDFLWLFGEPREVAIQHIRQEILLEAKEEAPDTQRVIFHFEPDFQKECPEGVPQHSLQTPTSTVPQQQLPPTTPQTDFGTPPGGGPPGGGGGMGQFLSLLPQLLQSLLQGGQQQQPPGVGPNPGTLPTVSGCPTTYQPVCVDDDGELPILGHTVRNQCVADRRKALTLYEAACVVEDTAPASSPFQAFTQSSAFTGREPSLVPSLFQNNVPEPLIQQVVRAVVSLMLNFTRGNR